MDRLTLMQQFVVTAEAGSLTRAATRLGCTEPTLSKRLSYLESQLGARLLVRGAKGVRLTEAGRRYAEACSRLLAGLREVEADVAEHRSGLRGQLRVYLPVTLGEGPLTRMAVAFQRQYPEVTLALALQDGWVDLPSTGADLAIRVGAVLDTSVVVRNLGGFELVLVASPGYLAKAGTPRTVEALAEHLYLRVGGEDEESLLTPEGPRSFRVHTPLTFNNPRAVLTAALEGAGVARLARYLVDAPVREGRLLEVLPGAAPAPIPVCAVYLPSRYPVEKVRLFVRFLGEALAQLPGWISPGRLTPPLGAPSAWAERTEAPVWPWQDDASGTLH